jgi:hypothetical protein
MNVRVFMSLVVCLPVAAFGQDGAAPAPADPISKPFAAPDPFQLGKLKIGLAGDGYYSYNANHPTDRVNLYHNFDGWDRFNLNMGRVAVDLDPAPVGFHFEAGAGRMYQIIHASEPKDVGKWSEFLPQFYVTLKPQSWKGLQFDFGKFYTSAGAEVTETYPNWNYTRSLLFAYGPYYHFGLRVNKTWNDRFSTGVQVVNGWNNIYDNNDGKTLGLTSSATFGKLVWSNNYYVGKEATGPDDGNRNFYDTVLAYNPSDRVQAYFNLDIGRQKTAPGEGVGWVGVAGAARFALNRHIALSPRLEWYNDYNGFMTGAPQRLKEFTFTGEYKLTGALLTRAEYRLDWSDVASFTNASGGVPLTHQNTFTVGLVLLVGKW